MVLAAVRFCGLCWRLCRRGVVWAVSAVPMALVAAVACADRLPAVLVVLAADFAGIVRASCMGCGGTIGGPLIDWV